MLPALFSWILAVLAVHVTNQRIILARYPEEKSRVVGGYMVFYSIGSGVGAMASTFSFAHYGWSGVSMVGAAFSAIAVLLWGAALRFTK